MVQPRALAHSGLIIINIYAMLQLRCCMISGARWVTVHDIIATLMVGVQRSHLLPVARYASASMAMLERRVRRSLR